MEDQLEKLASAYEDLYFAPTEARTSELDFKIADLEWEGLYLAAPAKVDADATGLPLLALMRRSDLHEWEVRLRKNSAVVFTDLASGKTGLRPLYNPPVKKMKPQPDIRSRKPEPDEGFMAGAIRQVIEVPQPESLIPGDYSVALISWDCLSNQRRIHKEGRPKPVEPAIDVAAWPWDHWTDTKKFQEGPSSPILGGDEGIVLKVEGQMDSRILSATVAVKARAINIVSREPNRKADPDIQAGVNVYLLLFSLDKYPPESALVSIPIMGPVPIHIGAVLKGWFTMSFPFKPSIEDRMLYAVVEGNVTGPIRVPGEKP